MKARLALENGLVLTGTAFGATGESTGEVVFNTSMSGYQEIFTDPSYTGQIVTMTYPLIGNYGVNDEDLESSHPRVAGVVVREQSQVVSNFRANRGLADWLAEKGIIGIEGIDTRMLTRVLRTEGAMRGILTTGDQSDAELVEQARRSPSMAGLDLATRVTCGEPYAWKDIDGTPFALQTFDGQGPARTFRVVAYDYGVKHNILRRLVSYGCDVTVVPASFPASEVLAMRPDGVFLSNGPGDPAPVTVAIENIRQLLGRVPIFGICLGHQLLSLALGGNTYKLKFGHRGGNHPVMNLLTSKIEITSQNHGFAVDPGSLDPDLVEITHRNLNDDTNEGIRHRTLPAFSVQYHPEASPGPHDSDYLFRDFLAIMETRSPVGSSPALEPR